MSHRTLARHIHEMWLKQLEEDRRGERQEGTHIMLNDDARTSIENAANRCSAIMHRSRRVFVSASQREEPE